MAEEATHIGCHGSEAESNIHGADWYKRCVFQPLWFPSEDTIASFSEQPFFPVFLPLFFLCAIVFVLVSQISGFLPAGLPGKYPLLFLSFFAPLLNYAAFSLLSEASFFDCALPLVFVPLVL